MVIGSWDPRIQKIQIDSVENQLFVHFADRFPVLEREGAPIHCYNPALLSEWAEGQPPKSSQVQIVKFLFWLMGVECTNILDLSEYEHLTLEGFKSYPTRAIQIFSPVKIGPLVWSELLERTTCEEFKTASDVMMSLKTMDIKFEVNGDLYPTAVGEA